MNEITDMIITTHICQCIHTGYTIRLDGPFIPQSASVADSAIMGGAQEYAPTQMSTWLVLKQLDVRLASAVAVHRAVLARVVQELAEAGEVVEEAEGDAAEVVGVEAADVENKLMSDVL